MIPVRRAAAAALALACAVGGLAACSSTPSAAPAAEAYLSAWQRGDLTAAGAATSAPAAATAALTKVRDDLRVDRLTARLGRVTTHDRTATAAFTASLHLAGLGDWTYRGRLALRRTGDRWQVRWTPADVHPRLTAATQLSRKRSLPDRAAILDGAGQPLFTPTDVITVGLEPARLTDPQRTYAGLAAALDVDPATLQAAVKAAQPHQFVPVITLRRADYEAVRDRIHDLPGTVFVEGLRDLPPTSSFGRALLGRVGEATADVLKAAGPPYLAGDELGIGGLQQAFQRRLAGTPSGEVDLVDGQGRAVAVLHRFAGAPGTPVRTTLDRAMQTAAERALDGVGHPAALVAVRPSDGAVLAVANAPSDSSFDRAVVGRYPPGSTFKVVTTYALLGKGVTADTPVPCPPTVTVEGRTFRNFEGEAAGAVPFRRDFAISCNTAFIGAARRLDPGDLPTAAAALGLGGGWTLPGGVFTGSVPRPASLVEQVADAIGQGKVEASPLAMAAVAAAVQSGTWRAPVLVTDPRHAQSPAPARPLDPARVATLRSLMADVVTSGTAAGAGLPSGTVGKTGTAEFGGDNPPKTHAWFIGYRGDLAVAVLVEGGGVGGAVAAPVAARFLAAVGRSE